MVERGGVRVDWLGGRDGMMEEGMEGERRRGGEEWGRNGEEQDESEDEGRRTKARRGMMLMKGKEEQEKDAVDNAEENMLELRLSLAVARSVPSPQQQQLQQSAAPPGSFVVHQHQNNHSHNQNSSNQHRLQQQQLVTSLGGREQSPVKPLMHRSSSPIENHRDSQSRANLTASLKHLVSQQQQQPVKVKSGPRIPGLAGSTAIRLQPLQYGVSPVPQLHRPHPPPLVRSSSFLQDGLDSEMAHFQGIGRLTSTAQLPSSGLVGQVGQLRQQQQQSGHFNHNQSHESLYPKGYPHQNNNQPRLSSHRIFPRTTLAGFPLQQSGKELLSQQERHQLGSIGQSVVLPSSPSGRIFGNSSYSPHSISSQAVNLPVTGPQLQAFLQNHSSNAVSVASHRQTQPPSSQSGVAALGNNLSAFSVVRPSISGTISPSIGDIPSRERSADAHHVIVSVCDRKVKLTSESDATPLYSFCRRWVRNDVLRRDKSVIWDCPTLPRPSPAAEAGTSKTEPEENCKKEEIVNVTQTNLPESIESMTEEDLLQHHVDHFKNVRKRFRDNRAQRIERFMPRLALLLPVNPENNKQ